MSRKTASSPPRARRPPGASRREFGIRVKFSADELAAVRQRAAQSGLAVGAFVGRLATGATVTPGGTMMGLGSGPLAALSRLSLSIDRLAQRLERLADRMSDSGVPDPEIARAIEYANKVLAQADKAILAVRRQR